MGDREALAGAAADRDRGDARCRLAAGEGGLEDFPEQTSREVNIRRQVEQVIIQKYAPSGVLVDDPFSVLYFHGDASKYLKPPQGEATLDLVRMSYVEEDGIVVYRSKGGEEQEVFDALEWPAAVCSHLPDKGEQIVRYYGCYSNVSRGKTEQIEARWRHTLQPRG